MSTRASAGLPLPEAIDRFGSLPEASVRSLGARLAEVLARIHTAEDTARDLTPSRVLLTLTGPRIIDPPGESPATGTPERTRYLAPEQVTLAGETSPASDVFSLGGILAFAATGKNPFGTGEPQAFLHRVVHEEPDLNDVPAALRPALAACLDKNPAGRPPAAAVADWLAQAESEVPLTAPIQEELARRAREASPPGAQGRRPIVGGFSRRRALGVAVGAFVGGGAITLALADGDGRAASPGIPHLAKPWVYNQPDYIDNGQLAAVGRTVVWWGNEIALGIDAITGSKVWAAITPNEVEWGGVYGANLLGFYTDDYTSTAHIAVYDAASGRPRFDRVLSQQIEAAAAGGLEIIDATEEVALIMDSSTESSVTLWAVSLSTGKTLWTRTGGISIAIADDRNCFLLDGSGVQRLDLKTGTLLWTTHEAAGMSSALGRLVMSDATLIVLDSTLLALDVGTGRKLWTRNLGDGISDIVVQDGRVFAAVGLGDESGLWALSARTGGALWNTVSTLPVVAAYGGPTPGSISADGDLLALSYLGGDPSSPSPSGATAFQASTGRHLWSYRDERGSDEWTVLAAGGNVYAATSASLLRAFPVRYR